MANVLPTFNPRIMQQTRAQSRGFTMDTAAIDVSGWETYKPVIAPLVWAWYDQHKNQKITKLFGIITITVSSFGIAEAVLTAIFGPRP